MEPPSSSRLLRTLPSTLDHLSPLRDREDAETDSRIAVEATWGVLQAGDDSVWAVEQDGWKAGGQSLVVPEEVEVVGELRGPNEA